jgi:C4-dicarboxylate transporter, DcuC family
VLLPGILILLIFLVAAGLMYTRKLPALLALPLMAVLIALVAGVSAGLSGPALYELIFVKVLTEGASRLAGAMVVTMFGAVLSQVVMRQGIAEYLIRLAAEYAGDRKQMLALVLFFAVVANFSALAGLGAVIMVGSLVLPILVSSGFSGRYAATLMLMGIAIGGILNPTNWRVYKELLSVPVAGQAPVVAPESLDAFIRYYALQLAGVFLVVALIYIFFEGKRQGKVFAWAAPEEGLSQRKVPLIALLTPVLPPILMLVLGWPDIPSFIAAILFGCLVTQPGRTISNVTAAMLEGLKDVAPVLALFLGLGMALKATMDDSTQQIMGPLLRAVLPTSSLTFVLFFTLLAPLTLYRGPFNLYGLGAGFAAMMSQSGLLPPLAVMTAFMSVGQVQSVCDPTNTHNVWIGSFVQESPDKILRHTLPYMWVYVLVALVYVVTVRRVMG